MKISFLILGLILFNSTCRSSANQHQKLKGDWMRVPERYEISVSYVGIRFDADTLYSIGTGLEVIGKYTLRDDTILVENYERRLFIYNIVKHTTDSLIISNSGSKTKYYSRNLEFDSSLAFTTIYLEVGPSSDHRPVFQMSLDKSGRVKFSGLKGCKVQGTKNFEMDKERLKKIDSLFQWSNIKRMDHLDQGNTTDQLMTLKIDYGRHQSKRINGEYFKMPFRLHGLIWNLFRELRIKELI